jgi:hypothetical protein
MVKNGGDICGWGGAEGWQSECSGLGSCMPRKGQGSSLMSEVADNDDDTQIFSEV